MIEGIWVVNSEAAGSRASFLPALISHPGQPGNAPRPVLLSTCCKATQGKGMMPFLLQEERQVELVRQCHLPVWEPPESVFCQIPEWRLTLH